MTTEKQIKTPIQELIEFMQKKFNILRENDLGTALEIGDCIEHAESMLEKEKEVIMEAYWEGGKCVPLASSVWEKYYNDTFNTK